MNACGLKENRVEEWLQLAMGRLMRVESDLLIFKKE